MTILIKKICLIFLISEAIVEHDLVYLLARLHISLVGQEGRHEGANVETMRVI